MAKSATGDEGDMGARAVPGTIGRATALGLGAILLAACSSGSMKAGPTATSVAEARASAAAEVAPRYMAPLAFADPSSNTARLDPLIAHHAHHYGVPESLIRRVIERESGYNPKARNGPYWGLMQILPATARTMGYRGDAAGLLDADTNMRYAVRYLRGAYMVGGYNEDAAVRFYSRGYYYDAKRQGLLEETGLR
jgi:soluble lytic murein transglycosylase-like protein